MSDPHACTRCLRRAWLLALLGPYIEPMHTSAREVSELLALDTRPLVELAAPRVAEQLLCRSEAMPDRQLREEIEATLDWATCIHDEHYPDSLRESPSAPRALFGRGEPSRLGWLELSRTVAVVGSRRATSYGREVARDLGSQLGQAGLTVLSGLAFGIDGCAHRGALDAGCRTVAVLGCGADVAYPAAHRSLWRRIGEAGLVISELPPGAAPWRWTFPARNRILAALAGLTVVVEAAERSASLSTADLAADGGREVGAVPGPITSRVSAGPNALLFDGASVIRDARDALLILGGSDHPEARSPQTDEGPDAPSGAPSQP